MLLKTHKQIVSLILIFFAMALLAACSSDGEGDPSLATPTPSATPDTLGYREIAPQACLVNDWTSLQTDKRQGSLVAFQPGTYNIAYLTPQKGSAWYVGLLSLAYEPDYSERIVLVDKASATGDLTWSPDGEKIAFLALRMNELVQTVMVADVNGGGLTDLFPLDAAQTDARMSQKAILDWRSEDRVHVLSSCGEDCQQAVDVTVSGSDPAPANEPERKNVDTPFNPDETQPKTLDGLGTDPRVLKYDPEVYPKGFSSPNWSPDGNSVLYLDRRGLLWLLDPAEKTQYLLDVGWRLVYETHWSDDSQRIAVRAEDHIFVFETPCSDGEIE